LRIFDDLHDRRAVEPILLVRQMGA
jgi:hypothetical protein